MLNFHTLTEKFEVRKILEAPLQLDLSINTKREFLPVQNMKHNVQ